MTGVWENLPVMNMYVPKMMIISTTAMMSRCIFGNPGFGFAPEAGVFGFMPLAMGWAMEGFWETAGVG